MAIEKVTIAIARKLKNMTQEDLADYCGVSVATVSNWENYRTDITVAQAAKVAEAVGLHYDEIIFLP